MVNLCYDIKVEQDDDKGYKIYKSSLNNIKIYIKKFRIYVLYKSFFNLLAKLVDKLKAKKNLLTLKHYINLFYFSYKYFLCLIKTLVFSN